MPFERKRVFRIFQIILGVLAFVSLYLRYDFKTTIEKKAPVEYQFKSQSSSFWRGTNYKLSIVYNDINYLVSISRATSDSIDAGRVPVLYYNKLTSSIIYEYHVSLALKAFLIFCILFLMLTLVGWYDSRQRIDVIGENRKGYKEKK